MPTHKQGTGTAAAALIAVTGVCAAALFALEWAGIRAPGPSPSLRGGNQQGPDAADSDLAAPVSAVNGATTEASLLQAAFGQTPAQAYAQDPGSSPSSGPASNQGAPVPEAATVLVTTSVRTTAYTHTEADHIKYGKKTALGTDLQYTPEYHSAAADWSRFPLGTKFRMKGVDRLFVVDDYGKALVGSSTIDIYFLTKERMNNWGVRQIDIEVVEFGNFHESRKILAARANYPHCREMLASMTSDDWWKDYR